MKELTLDGKKFLSTKRAAEITGYTTDYVGQLARQGKIDAQLVGRNWYIGEDSITTHKFGEAQVSIRKEEEERHAPKLEVLVSSASDVLENIETEESPVQKISINREVEESNGEEVLTEMQGAWQEWYRAQRSVPTEEEEVFLSKGEQESEEASVEVEIPITHAITPKLEEVVEEEAEEDLPVAPVQPIPSPLPVQRAWAGTGLALAGVLAIIFVGALTVTAGYVLTKNTDSPVAAVYQGVGDYVLGIKRFESK